MPQYEIRPMRNAMKVVEVSPKSWELGSEDEVFFDLHKEGSKYVLTQRGGRWSFFYNNKKIASDAARRRMKDWIRPSEVPLIRSLMEPWAGSPNPESRSRLVIVNGITSMGSRENPHFPVVYGDVSSFFVRVVPYSTIQGWYSHPAYYSYCLELADRAFPDGWEEYRGRITDSSLPFLMDPLGSSPDSVGDHDTDDNGTDTQEPVPMEEGESEGNPVPRLGEREEEEPVPEKDDYGDDGHPVEETGQKDDDTSKEEEKRKGGTFSKVLRFFRR